MKGKTDFTQKNRHDHSKNSFANIKSYISPILKLNYKFKAVSVLKLYVSNINLCKYVATT